MDTVVKKMYEAMFLVDSSAAASDWEGVNEEIKRILERSGTEIITMNKWAEQRLAYEVQGKTRGTYILCYFKADGSGIKEVEKSVQFSERVLRVLILRADKVSDEDIEKLTSAEQEQKQPKRAREGSQKGATEEGKAQGYIRTQTPVAEKAEQQAEPERPEKAKEPLKEIEQEGFSEQLPESLKD